MSARYQPVQWNRNKLIYDTVLVLAISAYLIIFLRLVPKYRPVTSQIDDATLHMHAYGSCAFVLLSFILSIGPLARLDARFLPLLYNRRHFGVLTCAVALAHASAVLGWYFNYSPIGPFEALISSNRSFGQIRGFPFELFGLAALFILGVLAATSHDFWLSFLSPPLWKAIHMTIYLAYALLVAHIALGALQTQGEWALLVPIVASVLILSILHLAAALKELKADRPGSPGAKGSQWVFACAIDEIAENCAKVVALEGQEKIAIFRYQGKLSAISNLCAHQNGPLGEGQIIDGCVTCPWHGFQYRPEDGRAPPPFTERLATYRLRLDAGRVFVDPAANAPGTYVEPIRLTET